VRPKQVRRRSVGHCDIQRRHVAYMSTPEVSGFAIRRSRVTGRGFAPLAMRRAQALGGDRPAAVRNSVAGSCACARRFSSIVELSRAG